jgi:serine/threonine protein kinase
LEHKNIVPLLGITSNPLQLVSDWMPGGDLTEYIKKNPNADRLCLVGPNYVVFDLTLIPVVSCLISPKAFTFFTSAT